MPSRVTGPAAPAAAAPTALTAATAKAWAEGVDFQNSPGLLVSRERAPTLGTVGQQRAYALYESWERNDLGSARVFEKKLDGQQLYALHTTTDGDDGFLELWDSKGLLASGVTGFKSDGNGGFVPSITWDSKAGAVRERVAPRDASPSVEAFNDAIVQATQSGSTSGKAISVTELKNAVQGLVGTELTTRSVDGFETAALQKVLADPALSIASSARAWAQSLGDLSLHPGSTQVKSMSVSGAAGGVQRATASSKGGEVGGATMIALGREAFGQLPTQLIPSTKAAAISALKGAGLSTSEATAQVEQLLKTGEALFTGRAFTSDSGLAPKATGVFVFARSADEKKLAAVFAPKADAPKPSGVDPRIAIRELTGVDREVEVLAERTTANGVSMDLQWRPRMGGSITATLSVPTVGDAQVSALKVPPVLERSLEEILEQHVTSWAGKNADVVGWVGRDDSSGPGFVLAWKPKGSNELPKLANVRIALGGAATVTARTSVGPADAQLASDLAVIIARAHAQAMVADPQMPDTARLEVALRTGWADASSLEAQTPADSAVGFDPKKEQFQWMLPRVWGDNAVFVTFGKDASVRVEDFN